MKNFVHVSFMRRAAIMTAVLLLGLTPVSSRASIIIAEGNNPQPDENVLLNQGMSGTTVFGTTNQTGTEVRFSSTTQTLFEPASGQARVEAEAGGEQVPLNNIVIDLGEDGGTFESLIFNAFIGGTVGDSGTLTISVQSVIGDALSDLTTEPFAIGNGENFFTITSDDEQSILSVSLSFEPGNSGFTDLRQVRIGLGDVPPPVVIPEPSTMVAALSGIVCLSLAGCRRLRRRTVEAKA